MWEECITASSLTTFAVHKLPNILLQGEMSYHLVYLDVPYSLSRHRPSPARQPKPVKEVTFVTWIIFPFCRASSVLYNIELYIRNSYTDYGMHDHISVRFQLYDMQIFAFRISFWTSSAEVAFMVYVSQH